MEKDTVQRHLARWAWLAAYWARQFNVLLDNERSNTDVEADEVVTDALAELQVPTDYAVACKACSGDGLFRSEAGHRSTTGLDCVACYGVGVTLTHEDDMDVVKRHALR